MLQRYTFQDAHGRGAHAGIRIGQAEAQNIYRLGIQVGADMSQCRSPGNARSFRITN